jgi:hypothetical protein
MVTGRPAWQVLAGAMPDGAGQDGAGLDGAGLDGAGLDEVNGDLATEVLYRDDPFGVAYLVAYLQPHSE